MATYDLTVARAFDDAGIRRRTVGLLTGSATYVVGTGDIILPADLKLGVIEFFNIPFITDGTNVYWPRTVYNANGSVTVFWFSATATAVGSGDLSTFSGRFEAVGR